ncbi:Peroxiredoxin-6 [Gracilariopsis chorda]|uniref:Peroxiredoxin-6 n=1 Tax=Gracilariopsis chorda TaxID=448386 RepID=A0A2V3IUC8_9FLOR|nr:Peroxiredoxin-6 [Gracilariopsis chorda]|eukprot:PXF45713.1 Peroxiredoxin-6 [Gracilariopsis chorda]
MTEAVPSGTETYSKLYLPSTDGMLRLGDEVPNFEANTTHGKIVFHDWLDEKWAILFSHPDDFTPVCTTEIGRMALKYESFKQKGVKVIALSCNDITSHTTWLKDVVAHCDNKIGIDFPMIADPTREIAVRFGMLDPTNKDKFALPLTARSVFIIGPDRKLKLSLTYPASVGRNMDEIERCVDALILSWDKSIATPANWPHNHKEHGMEGWVFLLPTVTKDDADKYFPDHKELEMPSGKPYMRLTPKQ